MRKTRELLRWQFRDVLNRLRYGDAAPSSCESIMVDPRSVTRLLEANIFGRGDSGRVVGGDWDLRTTALHEDPKFSVCHERFVNGKSWEEAGAYRLMLDAIAKHPGADGCRSFDDILERYDQLDGVYAQVAAQGKLLSRTAMVPGNFRESGGVYVHIDRQAEVVFGGGGFHRLAIAKILGLEAVPAQLGVVHAEALPSWRRGLAQQPGCTPPRLVAGP